MDIMDVIRQRHSVRQFRETEIPDEIRIKMQEEVSRLNEQSGLHMQLFFDEPNCFKANKPHYGMFSNCRNYLAIVGRKSASLDEHAGYYGQKAVLFAQSLGINSCWVALTHGKSQAAILPGEKLVIIIALGYGINTGNAHKSKPLSRLCTVEGVMPDWFCKGMEAAMLAPTAVNQQKFRIIYNHGTLSAKAGFGPCTKIDLGIVKCHFELASGHRFHE